MASISNWFAEVGLSGLLDIMLMTGIIYIVLIWSQRTRATFVLTGIVITAFVYLFSRQFNLYLTAAVFEKFFAVILIALVVIFGQELRNFFERVAVWSTRQRFSRKRQPQLTRDEVGILVRTVADLAAKKIGALLVLQGKESLIRHLSGGVELGGKLSEPLLKSIFDPNSLGHDGALIIEDDRVSTFAVHLPLSKNIERLGHAGTRHSAALGITEVSDAMSIVVSEERGTISIAQSGKLREIKSIDDLTRILDERYREPAPIKPVVRVRGFFKRNLREKLIAGLLSLALWLVLVHGAKITYKTFVVPVTLAPPSSGWSVTEIQPTEITVTFRGPIATLYFLKSDQIAVLSRIELKPGKQKLIITPTDIDFPRDITLESIFPKEIEVKLEHPQHSESPSEPPKKK